MGVRTARIAAVCAAAAVAALGVSVGYATTGGAATTPATTTTETAPTTDATTTTTATTGATTDAATTDTATTDTAATDTTVTDTTTTDTATTETTTTVATTHEAPPALAPFSIEAATDTTTTDTTTTDTTTTPTTSEPPPNDDIGDAQELSGASGSVAGTNVGATMQEVEPRPCGTGSASVWYTWTAGSDAPVTFSTGGSDFDTVLGVYIVSEGIAPVAENDDAHSENCETPQFAFAPAFKPAQGLESELTFEPSAGTTYFVAVDGYEGEEGSFHLSWLTTPNDDFADATAITSTSGSDWGNNDLATAEEGEPQHGPSGSGHSLWWSWTAPANGTMTLDTGESTIPTALDVYTGSSVADLTPVEGDVGSPDGDPATVAFDAVRGTTYRIAIDGQGFFCDCEQPFQSGTGDVQLVWSFAAAATAPAVTAQPDDRTVDAGERAEFSAAATGDPAPSVQWQVSDGGDFTDVSGATGTTLSFTAAADDDGKLYRAVFTNEAGSVTTDAARLSVEVPETTSETTRETTTETPPPSPSPPPPTTVAANVGPPAGSLTVVQGAAPSRIVEGSATTFTIVVTNNSADRVSGVSVSESLGAGLAFVSASARCSGTAPVVCPLGDILPGDAVSVAVTARTTATGDLSALATLSPGGATSGAGVSVAMQPPAQLPTVPPPPPLLPPPVRGELVNAQPVSGTVLVDGKPFLYPDQLHVGAVVDVTDGSIQLVTTGGDSAVFSGGVFRLGQSTNPERTTDLILQGGDFGECGERTTSARRPASVSARKKKNVIRRLWGAGHGHFRTLGRYSSATVRGTIWITEDLCDGTLTTVDRGLVSIVDETLGHTVYVPEGYSYLAPA